jgi:hypothetical protein
MDPQAIADLQVRNIADGQFLAGAAYSHLYPGTRKIKCGVVGKDRAGEYQKTRNKKTHKGRTKTHISILEAIQSCRDGATFRSGARHFSLR